MKYEWIQEPAPAEEAIRKFADELRAPDVVARILIQRGFDTKEKARAYLKPLWENTHNPLEMRGMSVAIERIEQALANGEAIMVFGDYDADGTTSVALVSTYLQKYHPEIYPYIPDRHDEGYGLSIAGMQRAEELGCKLVIALDCGIKGHREIEWAQSRGIDVIVCDHHLPGATLPPAYAILNPKQPDCTYPYKELCGCGIGFKLIQGLHETAGRPLEELQEYTDLVAVAISADLVPIDGENRILAFYGLKRLMEAPRPGLRACLPQKEGALSMGDVAFQIAPRINAAGRLQHGIQAVQMLMSETLDEGEEWGRRISENNETRKGVEREITQQALTLIESAQWENRKTTVVYHPSWHKGVVGIVASKLQAHYYRPTVVLTESKGLITGSVRSVKGFDVHAAIEACEDLLEQFGGHASAAGLSLRPERLDEFTNRFDNVVAQTLDADLEIPRIRVDAELSLADISWDLKRWLDWMEPFGMGNPQPIFALRGVRDTGNARLVGQDQAHLKFALTDGQRQIAGIGFHLGDKMSLISAGQRVDVCFRLVENHFRGQRNLEIQMVDVQTADSN